MENFLPPIRAQLADAFEQAQANPADAGANGRLGMTLQTYEQYASAEVCYGRARRLAPREFRWIYYLGTAQAALGRHGEAAATLREALLLEPDYLPARLKLAESLLAAGELAGSVELFRAVLKKQPPLAMAHYGLARALAAQGNLPGAVEHYRQAAELAERFGSAHYALALAYRKLGEPEKAQKHLALYQKDKTGGPPEDDPLLRAVKDLNAGPMHHLKKGVSLEAAGQLEQAAAEHERALEIDPQHVQAHVNLVPLYGRLGRPEKAELHYRAAAALNSNLADNHYNFGVLRNDQGNYSQARDAFRRALEINPLYAEAHNNLGYMLEREGKLDQALGHYQAAIQNQPNYRLAHFHLGRLLVHRGQHQQAIRHFHQTLKPEDEKTAGFLYGLAAAYARAGNRQSALHYAREARQRAAALGQTGLVASIDRDLGILEKAGSAR